MQPIWSPQFADASNELILIEVSENASRTIWLQAALFAAINGNRLRAGYLELQARGNSRSVSIKRAIRRAMHLVTPSRPSRSSRHFSPFLRQLALMPPSQCQPRQPTDNQK